MHRRLTRFIGLYKPKKAGQIGVKRSLTNHDAWPLVELHFSVSTSSLLVHYIPSVQFYAYSLYQDGIFRLHILGILWEILHLHRMERANGVIAELVPLLGSDAEICLRLKNLDIFLDAHANVQSDALGIRSKLAASLLPLLAINAHVMVALLLWFPVL
ncbi:hypothetical protein K435DRAFT_812795 [Dendrothele bispora CBS 962.96]|uniref:Uncharacterized protein n=1 Tax=Dendrothele bispora (strain CBS 962.96) TaxID=1314807 RepID=A0A4S8KN65_DENBC|nr:hypothetical protein K435DRAFT_812795 [Dendrothele bispora CBS 962.96]